MLNDNQIKRIQNLYELLDIKNEEFVYDLEDIFNTNITIPLATNYLITNISMVPFFNIIIDNKNIDFYKVDEVLYCSVVKVDVATNKFVDDIDICYKFYLTDNFLIGRKSIYKTVSNTTPITEYYSENPITNDVVTFMRLQIC